MSKSTILIGLHQIPTIIHMGPYGSVYMADRTYSQELLSISRIQQHDSFNDVVPYKLTIKSKCMGHYTTIFGLTYNV